MDESNKQLVGEVHAPIAPAPGHGQILDHEYVRNGVAEIFLEVEPLSRIPEIDLMRAEVAAWERDRNNRAAVIDWRFTTENARIKLKCLYPKL